MATSAVTGGARRAAAERTRTRLIDTGLALAETTGLEGLSVNAVVAAAGVSKGAFFHHFVDRTTYLVALHRAFHDAMIAEGQQAVVSLRPGRERLSRMATVYLDFCLSHPGVRALILEARGSLLIQDEVRARSKASADFAAVDFVALGWRHPRHAAQLWVAAVAECALMELELGRPDDAARETVRHLFDNDRD